ncbi:MAG: hypothetical protein DSM106950_18360 [Stigonema ocellatum SAG 48.90 = DSM 106950]|nr:hypothetical protein [Stigonema ocellatum SAG 48.90 = DSM 106950]
MRTHQQKLVHDVGSGKNPSCVHPVVGSELLLLAVLLSAASAGLTAIHIATIVAKHPSHIFFRFFSGYPDIQL